MRIGSIDCSITMSNLGCDSDIGEENSYFMFYYFPAVQWIVLGEENFGRWKICPVISKQQLLDCEMTKTQRNTRFLLYRD